MKLLPIWCERCGDFTSPADLDDSGRVLCACGWVYSCEDCGLPLPLSGHCLLVAEHYGAAFDGVA